MKLINKVKEGVKYVASDVLLHWKKPAKGNYVSYKELGYYALGGMGQHIIINVFAYVALSASNTFFGSTIGLRPLHLQYLALIQTVLSLFMYVLRGKIVDNTRTRMGRFRPYLAIMGLPIAVMTTILMFLPFETMTYTEKLLWCFAFAIAITLIYPLYTDTYTELGSVLTPKSDERAKLIMLAILISSFCPTIYQALIPLVMHWNGWTYYQYETYRYIMVPMGYIAVLFNLFAAFGCKERVITSRTYVQKVGLLEGISNIYRNKYWWIRNIANLSAFLESACSVILGWMFIYGVQNMATYSLITTVYGTASTIAMLVTPMLMKKIGNRNILLLHNTMNVILVTCMLLVYKNVWLFFLVLYVNTVFNQLQLVYNPVLNAEVKDYQQYLTGKRVDFMLSAAGQIFLPITMATGFVLPFLYEFMGLGANYDVLFDARVRNNMFDMLCICSITGAALNLIPFFFYRLSRQKHELVILSLKQRAAMSDAASGEVDPQLVIDVVDGVRDVERVRALDAPNVKAAAKAKRRAMLAYILVFDKESRAEKRLEYKTAREEHAYAVDLRERKEAIVEIYDSEQQKFETPKMCVKLSVSELVVAYAPNELADASVDFLSVDIGFAKNKKESTMLLKVRLREEKHFTKMQQIIRKRYPDGLKKDYLGEVHKALDMPTLTKEEDKLRNKVLSQAEKELMRYNKTFNYYTKALEMVTEYNNKKYFGYLEELYPQAVIDVAAKEKAEKEKEEQEKAAKKAALLEAQQERFASYSPKKQAKVLARRKAREEKQAKKQALEPAAEVAATEDGVSEDKE